MSTWRRSERTELGGETTLTSDARIALAVPAYNAARVLPRLFKSVAAQTVPFDEILVFDDCSTDNTVEVAKSFGAQVIRGDVNIGYCAAKNALLEKVSCDWLHFHDADDVICADYVARAKSRLCRDSFDALLFDSETIDDETGILLWRDVRSDSTLLKDPLGYMLANTVHHSCGIYSVPLLRAIGGFSNDPSVYYNEERAFHLRLAENGARFAVEPHVGPTIHHRPDNTWEKHKAKCCVARHSITKGYAERYPGRHRQEVADISWKTARDLAMLLEWKSVDDCLSLACANRGRIPRHGGLVFKALCAISPYFAIRLQELRMRIFKPQYRVNCPGWRV